MQIAPVAAAALSLRGYSRMVSAPVRRAAPARRPAVAAEQSPIRRGYSIDIIC